MTTCQQPHDTVTEELAFIFRKLEAIYRKTSPYHVLLFSTDRETLGAEDVGKAISQLVLRQPPGHSYNVYLHSFQTGNANVGLLTILARTGLITLNYQRDKDRREFEFQMHVNFGSRVTGYSVVDTDKKTLHGHHTKETICGALEQLLFQH